MILIALIIVLGIVNTTNASSDDIYTEVIEIEEGAQPVYITDDDYVIYVKHKDDKNTSYLKTYNIDTGEIKTLIDEVLYYSNGIKVSTDGRYIFYYTGSYIDGYKMFRYDRNTSTKRLLGDFRASAISNDGSKVFFSTRISPDEWIYKYFIFDVETNTQTEIFLPTPISPGGKDPLQVVEISNSGKILTDMAY